MIFSIIELSIFNSKFSVCSLRWENDVDKLGGDGNDQFRSNDPEIGYKKLFYRD